MNSCGRFSGSKPSALTTKSVFISNSDPETISGFFLPVSSGFPSLILSAINFSTLLSPINSFGLDSQINSTPSSSAFNTSIAEPGIFSLSLLYKHLTDFAFCLTKVLTQSIAVSPPPITVTSLPSVFKFPLSKFSTLSPKPFRFEAVKKSMAGKIFFKLFPGIFISRAL